MFRPFAGMLDDVFDVNCVGVDVYGLFLLNSIDGFLKWFFLYSIEVGSSFCRNSEFFSCGESVIDVVVFYSYLILRFTARRSYAKLWTPLIVGYNKVEKFWFFRNIYMMFWTITDSSSWRPVRVSNLHSGNWIMFEWNFSLYHKITLSLTLNWIIRSETINPPNLFFNVFIPHKTS